MSEQNNTNDCLMSIEHITKEFKLSDGNVLRACNDICIDIPKGKTTAIVGESGCGKSTLVKTIMGIHEPTSGRVMFHGQDITKLSNK
ncbi:MAG: ATP-binding cassette domain-containing protein, partial [Anaerovibrio sp.]|nr:ATP-binding cassette domain-containing protein [Anaerovibrio sp.]